jgi:hypothetical protein
MELKGRVTVVNSSYNPVTEKVEPTEVVHQYVDFDEMTLCECITVASKLGISQSNSDLLSFRQELKTVTGKNGFDFAGYQ